MASTTQTDAVHPAGFPTQTTMTTFDADPSSPAPGRFLEPHAKEILRVFGIDVPRFLWVETADEAVRFARRIGYPVVAKVVSSCIYCKSDQNGVETTIADDAELRSVFQRFGRMRGFAGLLVEERFPTGPALNVGLTRIDYRCGPAIFLERYGSFLDADGRRSCRLTGGSRYSFRKALKALGLSGFDRNGDPIINETAFEDLLANASRIVMQTGAGIEALILDPVRCTPDRCIVLDARVKFARSGTAPGRDFITMS